MPCSIMMIETIQSNTVICYKHTETSQHRLMNKTPSGSGLCMAWWEESKTMTLDFSLPTSISLDLLSTTQLLTHRDSRCRHVLTKGRINYSKWHCKELLSDNKGTRVINYKLWLCCCWYCLSDKRATIRDNRLAPVMNGLRYWSDSSHCNGGLVVTVSDRGSRVRGSRPALASLFYDAENEMIVSREVNGE